MANIWHARFRYRSYRSNLKVKNSEFRMIYYSRFGLFRPVCTSYSLEEKLIVVKYVQENKRNAAAKHFNLDAPMVGRWIRQSSKWEEENKKKKRSETPGRKAFYPKAKKILYSWIIE
ncbi:unnamed protein product [Rhizophagus irregularis]|nr:unnamed protein product [Rhizophagus irregularis]